MNKKFDIFLLILGIIFALITALLQLFVNIHLFNLKKYLYFSFYFIVFIYWLKDQNFKLKYFLSIVLSASILIFLLQLHLL